MAVLFHTGGNIMEGESSRFEIVFDQLCGLLKPLLSQDKFFDGKLVYLFFFFYDPMEKHLYFKGKDKEFEKDVLNKLPEYQRYGDLDISNPRELLQGGTVGKIFTQCRQSDGNDIVSYYYPYVCDDPEQANAGADQKIVDTLNKKRSRKIDDYSAIFVPLVPMDNGSKVVGIACLIGNGPAVWDNEDNKESWQNIQCRLEKEKTFIGKRGKERNVYKIIKNDNSKENIFQIISKHMADVFRLVQENQKTIDMYNFEELFEIVRKIDNTLKKDITKTLHNIARTDISPRKAVGNFIKKYTPMGNIIELYEKYEDVMFLIENYRDHYVHMFKVFVEGLPTINRKIAETNVKIEGLSLPHDLKTLQKIWALVSLTHDFAYPVQKFKGWSAQFFQTFQKEEPIGVNVDVQNILLNKEFADYIFQFAKILEERAGVQSAVAKKLFMTALLVWNDHGLISALMFLHELKKKIGELKKKIEKLKGDEEKIEKLKKEHFAWYFEEIENKDLQIEIAFAIALHNFHVWKFIFKDYSALKQTYLDFKKFPLAFLLTYFDIVQEMGRPKWKEGEKQGKSNNDKITIKEEISTTNEEVVSISFLSNEELISKKLEEINDLRSNENKKIAKKICEIIRFVETFDVEEYHFAFVFKNIKFRGQDLKFCANPECGSAFHRYNNKAGNWVLDSDRNDKLKQIFKRSWLNKLDNKDLKKQQKRYYNVT